MGRAELGWEIPGHLAHFLYESDPLCVCIWAQVKTDSYRKTCVFFLRGHFQLFLEKLTADIRIIIFPTPIASGQSPGPPYILIMIMIV